MAMEVRSRSELESKLAEAGDNLVVVDFYATWCGPCKRISPFVSQLSEKYGPNLVVLMVDVDEVEELVGEYSIEVMPTFVFKRNGKTIATLVGSNEQKLSKAIENHLNDQ